MNISGAAVTRIQEELSRREEQVPIIGLHLATEEFVSVIVNEILPAERTSKLSLNGTLPIQFDDGLALGILQLHNKIVIMSHATLRENIRFHPSDRRYANE